MVIKMGVDNSLKQKAELAILANGNKIKKMDMVF